MSQRHNILVTRPAAQNGPLVSAIEATGHHAVILPLLEITAFERQSQPQQCQDITDKVLNLAHYQHVIFISTNAVTTAWQWIDQYWPQLPVGQTWYAIGNVTAAAINALDVDVEQAGTSMNSESLLLHPDLQVLHEQKVLIVRGQGGREHLKTVLQQRGASVDYCEVYARHKLRYQQGELGKILAKGLDLLTVTSAETIQQLLDQAIIDSLQGEILQLPIVVPGERLFEVAKSRGFKQVVQAENAGLKAMLTAIKTTINIC